MHVIRIGLISFVCLFLFACTVTPIKYDLDNQRVSTSTKVSGSFDALRVGEFYYSPPGNLGQFEISSFGCLPCRSDGSRAGFRFASPVKDIVTAEVKSVLKDFQLAGVDKKCSIDGVINLLGQDINGEQTLDITYSLIKDDREIVKKRILETNYGSLFSPHGNGRQFERLTQKSIENFLMSKSVSEAYKKNCIS